ncbi:MAG: VOC family protein [Actinomycetota bacterium]|nr:VOC family protein [Actinomycetota bacterium]
MVGNTSFIPGSVCWIEVSSTDPAGSRDFYAGLFGWTYQIDPDPGRRRYTTALCAGRPVAGLASRPLSAGQPVTWTLYLTSANIRHTAEVVSRWGDRVLYGPADVPGRGRVLIGTDPTGAVIGFWQPAGWSVFHTADPGSLYWAELDTWDAARADNFFAHLFGYYQQQIGDGVNVNYTVWSRGGRTMLGRLQMTEHWAAPGVAAHWMLHFAVDPQTGTDAAVDQVLELGGRVDVDPYDTELGRIARVADPCDATFALIDPTIRLQPAPDLAAGSARVDDPYDD